MGAVTVPMIPDGSLSAGLWAAANSPAIPRYTPPADSPLVQAAREGLLTRANTEKGSAGRQAVERATYLGRDARRAPGETAREALGHHRESPASLTGWITGTNGQRFQVVAEGPAAVARLAARLHDEREVASGRMSPSVFADRWRGRQVGGVRVSARSAVVNASLHRAGAETEVRYLRGARK